ncbi:MAG: hypothetical protein GX606_05970 [Elusimicrobia bacterium]|nr:hypothetical protein [Elusimicrobiota bacterium]
MFRSFVLISSFLFLCCPGVLFAAPSTGEQYFAAKEALDQYEGFRRPVSSPEVPVSKPVVSAPSSAKTEGKKIHETEMGLEAYTYRYEELVGGEHFMDLEGKFYGLYLVHTFRPVYLDPAVKPFVDLFRFEMRYAWADLDYDGGVQDGAGNFVSTLVLNDVKDYVWEARALAAKEYEQGALYATPYVGFGMRFLHDDSTDSVGTFDYLGNTYQLSGYKRTSEYYYLPVGLDVGARLGGGWTVGLNGEFDIFLYGHQKSFIEDVSGRVPKNVQNEGYGLQGAIRLKNATGPVGVSLEPFVRYWNIEDSEVAYGGMEPTNSTVEFGMKMGILF